MAGRPGDTAALVALALAIADVYEAGCGAGRDLLLSAARELREAAARPIRITAPSPKPVLVHLARAAEDAAAGPLFGVAKLIADVGPWSEWRQNPNYSDATMGNGYMENYGYVEILGPGRPLQSQRHLVGFMLLGTDRLYPPHVHPAEEVYHPVAGADGRWWRQGSRWAVAPLGAPIHHASGMPHATRSGAVPLLALYCWGGDIHTPARLMEA